MFIKLSFTKEEFESISARAKEMNMSEQDYLRFLAFGKRPPEIFTPENAVRLAKEKFTADDEEPFYLTDLYPEEWAKLGRMSGIFGKRFFNYITENEVGIEFAGIGKYRRASYRIVKK